MVFRVVWPLISRDNLVSLQQKALKVIKVQVRRHRCKPTVRRLPVRDAGGWSHAVVLLGSCW
ncbi:hypothetical protein RchiOBHm_Chr3g0483961 [Rosa chinensis]|uniref:Uncharacterized protein n=1 Tax=Rosa chinensis TaxID=74649 RepID=A0A2P6REK8_ROSCH|nr:hypothetical protein RchiOBHm_Chr3g0483961 [Rosa chinensis]